MGYVLALPEAMCDILLKCLIHILKAHDISSQKIQEKVEIIKNNILQFWTKICKNGYCAMHSVPNGMKSQTWSDY